ncbi:MAG: CheR family methyltransferase [Methanobacteriota archaeon]
MSDPALTNIELARLSTFVQERIGLYFPPEKYDDLRRSIALISSERGFISQSACLAWILSTHLDRSLIEMLSASLTVGETYFFREPDVFQVFEDQILPTLISKRWKQGRILRIWSAACSTGEEAYTLAILVSKIVPEIDTWSITILGTDINPQAIKTAETGIYREWSFRSIPSSIKDRFFQRLSDGRYQIGDTIRNLVTFSYLNLGEDTYPSLLTNTNAMDLIFCRNVLMYFSKETIQETIDKLQKCLVPDGRMITSMTETMLVQNKHLAPDVTNGFTTYQKVDMPESGIVAVPPMSVLLSSRDVRDLNSGQPMERGEPDPIVPVQGSDAYSDIPTAEKIDEYSTATRLFESGDYTTAERTLMPFIAQNPADHRSMALMAQILANQGDLPGAHAWCDKAIILDKLNPFYHHILAIILQEKGEVEAATKELRRVLYADPSYIPAHFTLAHLKHRQGKEKESEVHVQNIRELLRNLRPDEIIPGTGGMSAGYLEQNMRIIIEEEHYS